jgi:hypothetical protein
MPATHTGNGRWGIGVVALTAGLTLAGCGAAGLTGGGNGTGSSPTPSQSAAPTPSPTPSGEVTIAELTKIAEQAAIEAHDPGVRVADAVLTTRQAAVTLVSGDGINSNEAVYLVQLVGQFTLTDVSIPPGGKAPTGTDLSLDVDVSDGNAVDTGLSLKAADLSSLGPVIALTW